MRPSFTIRIRGVVTGFQVSSVHSIPVAITYPFAVNIPRNITNTSGIHSGANTHPQLQPITPNNFNVMKISKSASIPLMPDDSLIAGFTVQAQLRLRFKKPELHVGVVAFVQEHGEIP